MLLRGGRFLRRRTQPLENLCQYRVNGPLRSYINLGYRGIVRLIGHCPIIVQLMRSNDLFGGIRGGHRCLACATDVNAIHVHKYTALADGTHILGSARLSFPFSTTRSPT